MYKLYIKNNNVYERPQRFKTYEEAKKHAKGEYVIVKREENTDVLIEYNMPQKSKIDDDWER